VSRAILDHLLGVARTRGVPLARLETGVHQHAAIALYESAGFRRIPPFGPYFDDPVSRCYELALNA
jgi:putative acetyltransferase